MTAGFKLHLENKYETGRKGINKRLKEQAMTEIKQ